MVAARLLNHFCFSRLFLNFSGVGWLLLRQNIPAMSLSLLLASSRALFSKTSSKMGKEFMRQVFQITPIEISPSTACDIQSRLSTA
jgi:hypothetical protein